MRLCFPLLACYLLCGCTLFSTRTTTDETRDKETVTEETHIAQEYHDGQIVELKKTVYKTEISKEVAAIKSNRETSVPAGGMSLSALIPGGGLGAIILGIIGKKLHDRVPPTPVTPAQPKGRSKEDDAT